MNASWKGAYNTFKDHGIWTKLSRLTLLNVAPCTTNNTAIASWNPCQVYYVE